MQLKIMSMFFLIVITIFATNISAREIGVVKKDSISDVDREERVAQKSPPVVSIEKDLTKLGRVICQSEEAIEDIVCQKHCLPKGYSYGVCVSKTCSCV